LCLRLRLPRASPVKALETMSSVRRVAAQYLSVVRSSRALLVATLSYCTCTTEARQPQNTKT